MGNGRALGRTGTTQAIFAAFTAAVILTPIFWFIGVLHFGAITGPDPTVGRMMSYLLWTWPIGVLVAAPLLHLSVRAPRRLSFGRACVVAAAGLAPAQAATWVITLYQWGNDDIVAFSGLTLTVTTVVLLARSPNTRRGTGSARSAGTAEGGGTSRNRR